MKAGTKLLWILSLVVVGAVAVGGTWAVARATRSSALAETEVAPSWLFTEGAGGGTFRTNADGTHTLTLTDLDPTVTAFTDRPERDTALVPFDLLFSSWARLFADSPPNAVLVEHDPRGDTSSYVVRLTDPKLDGTTGTFTAEVVKGKDHSDQVPGLSAPPNLPPPATFGAVSLFIDDVDAAGVANKPVFHPTKVA